MTPGQFRRLDEVFSFASALPAPERAGWLDRETADDPELRAAAHSLLAASQQASDFLERPAFDFLASRLGPWRVVRELGRGGMSLVFLGERADGQYDQQVAIKITTSAIGAETRLLARLQHPNIARLLDAGETATGFPYLVMEFVEGLPFDEWLLAAKPPLNVRLQVFRDICAAVQYAHQNLILHRDLKPSNLLVTPAGSAKLLDFGIAKPLEAGATPATQMPAFSIDYASPEQMTGQPLSTASDVYALGIILHLAITGSPPRTFAGRMFRDAVEQAARHEPPSAVSGDLGQIIRKATQVDPRQRYPSAADLAADVERYLDGRPILAQPPAFTYLAKRFLGRHRWKIAIATAVFAALSATATIAISQARAADRRFQQVRGLARSVLFELHDGIEPLPGSNPARRLLAERALVYLEALAGEAGHDVSLIRELAEGYLRLGDVQGGTAVRNLGLYAEAAVSFQKANALAQRLRLATPNDPEAWALELRSERPLLQAELAGKQRTEALARIEQHLAKAEQMQRRFPQAPGIPRIIAEAHSLRAMGFLYNARPQALDEYLRALALYEKLPARTVYERSRLAGMHQFLSDEYERRKNFPEALRHIQEAVRLQQESLRLFPGSFQARFDVTKGRQQLGSYYLARARHDAAIEAFLDVAETRAKLAAEEPTDVVTRAWLAQAHSLLGLAYSEARSHRQAVESLARGVEVYRSLAAVEKNSQRFQLAFADSLGALADATWRAGRHAEACAVYRDAESRYRGIVEAAVNASLQSGTRSRVAKALAARCPGDSR
jgi:tetratricopeptide (TPR) repeat protein/tRNA A-37 threonylcarbamoyl transferase component Bud32